MALAPTADPAHSARTVRASAETGPAASNGAVQYAGLFAFAAFTVALIALCVMLSAPFLPALAWGVALAIIALPVHRWIQNKIVQTSAAAGISTVLVVVVILLPGLFVAYQLAREARAAAEHIPAVSDGQLRARLIEIPALEGIVDWMDRVNVDVEAVVRQWIISILPDASSLANGSAMAVFQLLAAVFILFYVLRDRHEFLDGLRELLPMRRVESDRVLQRAADSVHASVFATMVTGLIDASCGGLMFWLLGLPSPLLWASVMFVLSIIPIVGAAMVWFPAAVYLVMTDRVLAGLALLGWGLASFVIVGNLLYARLVGERMRLHDVPALIAFVGGLAIFGISGMILGPAILAVTVAVLEVWKGRVAGAAVPPTLTNE